MSDNYNVYVNDDTEPNVSVSADSDVSALVDDDSNVVLDVEEDAGALLNADINDEELVDVPIEETIGELGADHRRLTHRDAADQHPMSAITGLTDSLTGLQNTIDSGLISVETSVSDVTLLANGKNTVYHSSTMPTGGEYKVGDTWFNSSESYCMYKWDGSNWIREQFGNGAFANASIWNATIKDGEISNAKISSLDGDKITANSLTLGKMGSDVTNAITNAANTANSYITTISGYTGICVHDASDTSNFANLNSSGMGVYQGGSLVASFGGTARVGKTTDTNVNIVASSTDAGIKMNVKDYYGTSNVRIADIGFDNTQGYETSVYFPKGAWYTLGYRAGTAAQRGYYSLVNGFNNRATHNASVALGIDNNVYAPCALAIGLSNTIGNSAKTSQNSYSESNLSGTGSLAVGYGNQSTGQYQIVCGVYNSADANAAIIVGNGYSSSSRSNAFTVSKSGAVSASNNITTSGIYYSGSYKLLTTGTVSMSLEVSAKSTNADTVTPSKTGYKAIGIIGKQVTGSSSTFCHMYTSYMDSSGVIHVGARNFHESNNATMDIVFYVLYVASSQGV